MLPGLGGALAGLAAAIIAVAAGGPSARQRPAAVRLNFTGAAGLRGRLHPLWLSQGTRRSFLARRKKKAKKTSWMLAADVPSQISKWFLELPFERLCQLQLPESEKDKAVHNDAVKYLAKWNTAVWVTRQNYDCGVAPTYDKLVQKYYEELEQRSLGHLGHQLRTSAEGRDGKAGCAGRAARAWCGRFCKQFAFSRKSLRESVQLSADELEEKATFSFFGCWCAGA